MTIKERIQQAEQHCEGERGAEFTGHWFPPGKLQELLQQVAKEQRKLCSASARRMYSKNTGKIGVSKESILNAPSPLNEDSHE